MRVTPGDYKPLFAPEITWCAGCGDYGILAALQRALAARSIPPHRTMVVAGIGCGSKLPDYIHCNNWQTLHGRALPIAQGFRLAQHGMTVIAVTGDGDGLGEGGNHWLHAMRRNVNLTHVIEDNLTYGLTKGQTSPTSQVGYRSATTPDGSDEPPVNPLAVAIAAGATFVARGFAGDVKALTELLSLAIAHEGYALVDVLQPCVTWNRKVYTYDWFEKRVYSLADEGHDATDRNAAFVRAQEWDDRIPLGIFYRDPTRPAFDAVQVAIRSDPATAVALRALPIPSDRFDALKRALI